MLNISGCSKHDSEYGIQVNSATCYHQLLRRSKDGIYSYGLHHWSLEKICRNFMGFFPTLLSLLHLRLWHCNLSEDAFFPRDVSSLSSWQELDLTCIPICILPDHIASLIYRAAEIIVFEHTELTKIATSGHELLHPQDLVSCVCKLWAISS